MKNGYIIYDRFNDTIISRHRSLEAAIKANEKKPHFMCDIARLQNGEAVSLTEADHEELDYILR